MPQANSNSRSAAPRALSGSGICRGLVAAFGLLALTGTSQAALITVVNQTIIDSGITATNSQNAQPTWVVGGTGTGDGTTRLIDYGSTQRPAIFTSAEGPAGTGNFNSFLGLNEIKNVNQDPGGADTLEQGHNTGNTNQGSVQGEVEYGTHTDDIQATDFGIVTIGNGGTWNGPISSNDPFTDNSFSDPDIVAGSYLSIAYDMNPINSIAQPRVTINQFQVFLSPTLITAEYANGPATAGFNLGTKVWDLDANSVTPGDANDHSITVHDNNNGSGSYDLAIYIRVGDILEQVPSATGSYYVYVWMETDTYDEFNHNDLGSLQGAPDAYYPPPGSPIPEPGNLSLIGVSLLLFALRRRRKA